MNQVWEHTFRRVLGVDSAEEGTKIMLTNPPLNPTASRLRMMEAMFERHGFSALSIQVQAGLTLYAQGADSRPMLVPYLDFRAALCFLFIGPSCALSIQVFSLLVF